MKVVISGNGVAPQLALIPHITAIEIQLRTGNHSLSSYELPSAITV